MTVDECARTVTREIRQAVNRAYFRKTTEPEILPAVTTALQALARAERERVAAMTNAAFHRAAEQGDGSAAAWLRELRDDILATSPGKQITPVDDGLRAIELLSATLPDTGGG